MAVFVGVFLEPSNLCFSTRGLSICSQSQLRNIGMHQRGELWDVKTKGNTVKSACVPQGWDITWWSTSDSGWPLSVWLRNRPITYRHDMLKDTITTAATNIRERQSLQCCVWVENHTWLPCYYKSNNMTQRTQKIITWCRPILRNQLTLISGALVKLFHYIIWHQNKEGSEISFHYSGDRG